MRLYGGHRLGHLAVREGLEAASASVSLNCFGPEFPSEAGEQLLIEFGLDLHFLPDPDQELSLSTVRHNIRGLLHLVEDLDASLAVQKRQLWSESGENFADRLKTALVEG